MWSEWTYLSTSWLHSHLQSRPLVIRSPRTDVNARWPMMLSCCHWMQLRVSAQPFFFMDLWNCKKKKINNTHKQTMQSILQYNSVLEHQGRWDSLFVIECFDAIFRGIKTFAYRINFCIISRTMSYIQTLFKVRWQTFYLCWFIFSSQRVVKMQQL